MFKKNTYRILKEKEENRTKETNLSWRKKAYNNLYNAMTLRTYFRLIKNKLTEHYLHHARIIIDWKYNRMEQYLNIQSKD